MIKKTKKSEKCKNHQKDAKRIVKSQGKIRKDIK